MESGRGGGGKEVVVGRGGVGGMKEAEEGGGEKVRMEGKEGKDLEEGAELSTS